MDREKNVAIYSGDTINIRIRKDPYTPGLQLMDLKVKWIGFDIVWAQLSDGTDVEIFLNQSID